MSSNIVRKAKICWWKFSISLEHDKKIGARLLLLRRDSASSGYRRVEVVRKADYLWWWTFRQGLSVLSTAARGHSDPAFQHSFVYSQAMHRQTSAVRSSSILLSLLTFHYSSPAHQAIFNMPLPAFFRCIYIMHMNALATPSNVHHHVHHVK